MVDLLLFDGLDNALIGHTYRKGEFIAVYDYEKMVEIFMKEHGMSEEDAVEWIDFNVLGAWIGEQTPMIVFPFEA